MSLIDLSGLSCITHGDEYGDGGVRMTWWKVAAVGAAGALVGVLAGAWGLAWMLGHEERMAASPTR